MNEPSINRSFLRLWEKRIVIFSFHLKVRSLSLRDKILNFYLKLGKFPFIKGFKWKEIEKGNSLYTWNLRINIFPSVKIKKKKETYDKCCLLLFGHLDAFEK